MTNFNDNDPDLPELEESVIRLTKDLRVAAETLTPDEARFLVDSYYTTQADRIRHDAQVRALTASKEPSSVIGYFSGQSRMLEKQMQAALDRFSAKHPIGKWMRQFKGVGPVIAAGFIAHIDIANSATASQLWSFAGLTSESNWLGSAKAAELVQTTLGKTRGVLTVEQVAQCANAAKRSPQWVVRVMAEHPEGISRADFTSALAKRPWNNTLKVLCWKLGQSFMKVSGKDDAIYGKIYRDRKNYEVARNERGDNADKAKSILASKNIGKDTDAFGHLSKGKLPPAQIDARARRYAVKRFLSHLHETWRKLEGLPVRDPYPMEYLGHTTKDAPPGVSPVA